ncbi:MAG: cyclic nucleotide-binding domain-containing protein [Proteobacteria bacterium]|nr:cyclic nucleotide-binding domain-containing protein [Pseudomonadota bacterium]MBU1716548.1 cyclic nucleotide-binding domain-containing protein [Pseudomonadota bacterium]
MASQRKLSLWKNKTALIFALEKIPMFNELSEEELTVIINYMSLYELAKGETLFKEGDDGQYVCFVVDGQIDVMKTSITGSKVVITTLSQGYSIGEMSMIDRTPRSATTVARSNVTLAVMAQSGFKLILDKHPAIGIKILIGFSRFLSKNMRATSARLNAYTHLLSTMCAHTGQKFPHDIDKYLRLDNEKLVHDTHSISTLFDSKTFMIKVKKFFGKKEESAKNQ